GSQLCRAGEGLRNLPTSAQSQGMVGSNLALSRDPSVARLNPANMLDLDRSSIQFTLNGLYGQTDFDSPGRNDSMKSEWIPIPSFHFVHRPSSDSKWAFGIGANAPFGLALEWPREGAFQFTAPYESDLKYITLNPAVAYQASDAVSIGFGLDIAYSSLNFKQDYPWGLVTMDPTTPGGGAEFDGDGGGLGAYLGSNLQLAEKHRMSVIARLPVEIEYSGDYSVGDIPPALGGAFSPESDFETDLTYPGSVALAYRYDFNEDVRLGFQYEWIGNSSHDDIPINVSINQPFYAGNDRLILDWRDSFSIGLGGEWDVNDKLTLRAGYLFSESPIGRNTFSPAIPLTDRHMFSVGGTYHLNDSVSLSVAYINTIFKDANIDRNIQPAFLGDYEINWQSVTTSLTYRW
ncbi:outer membrane protein transport protein, partial [Akkermansiaceae bacterium]|nr:outer membrane protein transport protein [Akkermansiaceae bacterium]